MNFKATRKWPSILDISTHGLIDFYLPLSAGGGNCFAFWSLIVAQLSVLVGCHFKKEFVLIRQEIERENYDCYPTTPVLRCLDECQATETKTTRFPMTCVKTGSVESMQILKEIEKRTLDLTESEVIYTENLTEHVECDCSICGQ